MATQHNSTTCANPDGKSPRFRSLINRVSGRSKKIDAESSHGGSTTDAGDATATGLGPHAQEDHMPWWLVRVLKDGDRIQTREVCGLNGVPTVMNLKIVETPALIAVLSRISEIKPDLVRALYCSPHVHHVAKLRREGSFCGYRNLQMMISYICNAKEPGHQHFDQHPVPSIFLLQGMIEDAWESGYNTASRDDVGKLRMTRKFIGTSEVEALLLSIGTPVVTRAFVSTAEASAFSSLTQHISNYFESAILVGTTASKVTVTSKAPVFLQRPGHSMMIVGIDKDVRGKSTLVVFDPIRRVSKRLVRLTSQSSWPSNPILDDPLGPHRYGVVELGQYDAFEIVQFDDRATMVPMTVDNTSR